MSMGYCNDQEGWGPMSNERVDLTPCFEYTMLATVPAFLAIFAFVHWNVFLHRSGNQHGPSCTNNVFDAAQVLMLAAALVLFARTALIIQEVGHSPANVLANASTGVAWALAVVLNVQEHKHGIWTSTPIFCYLTISIVTGAITTRTLSALVTTSGISAQYSTSTITNALYYSYFIIIILGLVSKVWPCKKGQVGQHSNESLSEKANIFSQYWFHYIQKIIALGCRRPLQQADIEDMMPRRIKTQFSYSFLSQQWDLHVAKRQAQGKEPRLLLLVLKAYGKQWIPIIIYRILASAMGFVAPELMNLLLGFSSSYNGNTAPQPVALGIILSFGMFFSTIASTLLEGQFNQLVMNMGIEVRTALISAVYRKALKLSPAAKLTQTPGEISNHMSVDAERWSGALPLVPMWGSIPFEICIAMWLLYRQLGWAALAGLGTIIAVAPLQAWIAAFLSVRKDQKLQAMDNRIRLMSELVSNIKVVKLYGWESSFRSKVAHFRNCELAILRKIGIAFSFMTIMFSSITLLMALVSFSIYAAVGGPGGTPGKINSQTIFVPITLFGLLNRPIEMLSHIIGETIGLIIATHRIQKYLLEEELSEHQIQRFDYLPQDPSQPVIEIQDGVFAWDKKGPEVETLKQTMAKEKIGDKNRKENVEKAEDAGPPGPVPIKPEEYNYKATLNNINLMVHKGQLTAIIGRVGQGKTSLFDAMIGNMYKLHGVVKMYGQVAYTPQQAWIMNATLRDNILFGAAFNQDKYERIVYATGLVPDFDMLPAGDLTEIGEQGINLSGGQKQRVSLARAAYLDADIYLLDDPLSAVDPHVDQHLWQNLIGPTGLLKDKTRILVTHGIHHLSEVDQIVVINNGMISETGQYQELLDAEKTFYQLIKEYSLKEVQRDMDDTVCVQGVIKNSDVAHAGLTAKCGKQVEEIDKKLGDNGNLIEEEMMKVGSIQWHVYWIYVKAVSPRYVIQVLFLFIIIQCCHIGTNTWLQNWVMVANTSVHSIGYFMGVYAVLIVFYNFLLFWTSYTTLVTAGVRASERLHNNLINNVLHLPMSFFDTTPVGRIINRFSSDCFSIDEQIPWVFHDIFFCGVSVLGSILVITVITPAFLIIVPPIIIVFISLQQYYIASSINFRRIESVAKSPMYQHFAETLSGISTIRAMRCIERFITQNASKSDVASNAHFVWGVGNHWLSVRLEALGSMIVLAASLFAVFGRNSLSSSMVGMSLSYALSITQNISWLVRFACEAQFQMVAVERVDEYSNKNQEAPNFTEVTLSESWPEQGQVSFKNYSTRYRQGMDLVLQNVSFDVQPGEKVGIVGRTGAGKSSLTLALFRIIEAANGQWANISHDGRNMDTNPTNNDAPMVDLEKVQIEEDGGSIWIDGIDISTLSLEYLRQHLAIIPQDPILFVGTIRDNLDPFEQATDFELWEALEHAHLKEYISSMPGGLLYEVAQNGENFSVGQRSLVCLARALLRKTKILILDEATAAVDVETDKLIQMTIQKEFKDRTIFTIAHRIKTVIDSDKILVLEKGCVQEYEAPSELLLNKESLFYRLAEQAGEI